jgi:hypothetical protein
MENDRIQTHALQSDYQLEAVIALMMIWSDATHLTQFGHSSLWPIYFYPGNLSKYTRAKPSALAAHHLAYIPKVGQTTIKYLSHPLMKSGSLMTRFKTSIVNITERLRLLTPSPICAEK